MYSLNISMWLSHDCEKILGGTRTGSVKGGAAVETALSLVACVLCVAAKVCLIGWSLALSTAAAVVKHYPPSLPLFLPCLSFFLLLPFTLITVWESSVSTTHVPAGATSRTRLFTVYCSMIHVKLVNYFLLHAAQGS